ncbi:hypothetical protein HZB00_02610 [Candidatus Woesearchaeota archaeon]|nr:hypothetical protein [Candidatus Woesearchaeota archaeon]
MNYTTKKGVSPLIATVIVIGFTIVLAALLITFGTNFFKGQIAQQEKTSQISTLCGTGLANLDVKASKSTDPAKIDVSIDNKNDAYLWGYIIRAYESATKSKSLDASFKDSATPKPAMGKFETTTVTLPDAAGNPAGFDATKIKEVGVLVQVSGCPRADCSQAELKANPPTFCPNEVKAQVF